jgi:formylglycine-generating enzyme
MNYQYNIALSFAEQDHDAALALKLALEAAGIERVYYYPDYTEETWGQPLARQLALVYAEKARYAVVFLSKHYFNKQFTNIEFEAIQKRVKQDAPSLYMLPVLIGKDTDLGHPALKGLTYIQWEHNPKVIANTLALLLGKTEQTILADEHLAIYHPLFEKGNYQKVFWRTYRAVGGGVRTAFKAAIGVVTASVFGVVAYFLIPSKDMAKVELPTGKYIMGAHSGRREDMPAHTVQLSDFSIGSKEVTIADYRKYCDGTGRPMPPPPDYSYSQECPIVNITYQEAADYCAWVKGRLPTEAEWEYAAFENGNGTDRYSGANNINEVGYYEKNSNGKSHPGARKNGGKFGLYDMSGNVAEWCADWYGDYHAGEQTNPQGPDTGSKKVIRGGHYASMVKPDPENNQLRITYRSSEDPAARKPYIGFRVVWDK